MMWRIWVGDSGATYISRGERSVLILTWTVDSPWLVWFEWHEGLVRRLT